MDKKFLIVLILFLAILGTAALSGRDKETETPVAASSSPLSAQDAQHVVSGQKEAQRIWEEEKARLGDNIQAKRIAAGRIASLQGVRSAGVTAEGTVIWIEYATGIKGGLLLNPEGTKSLPAPGATEQ